MPSGKLDGHTLISTASLADLRRDTFPPLIELEVGCCDDPGAVARGCGPAIRDTRFPHYCGHVGGCGKAGGGDRLRILGGLRPHAENWTKRSCGASSQGGA